MLILFLLLLLLLLLLLRPAQQLQKKKPDLEVRADQLFSLKGSIKIFVSDVL